MTYAQPGQQGSVVSFKSRYDNFIGGAWVPPVEGRYFENVTPVTGQVYCEVARSSAADIEAALDAAHAARQAWGATSVVERSNMLLQIADRVEQNLEMLAVAETWKNGKSMLERSTTEVAPQPHTCIP